MRTKKALIILLFLLAFVDFFLVREKKMHYKAISFIAVGDTGTGEEEQYRISTVMKKTCDTIHCTAFILLGDNIYPKGVSSIADPQFQTKFELIYRDIFKPFYVAFGNHDHLGCIECEIAYSTMSAKWKLPNYYYKQSFEDLVDLFVIDTEKLNQEQVDWAIKELQQSKAKWKILVGHHPFVAYDSRHESATEEQKYLLEKILCNKNIRPTIYIAGHAHNLEDVGDFCNVRLLVSGGGGAPLGALIPNKAPFASSEYGFMSIVASEENIKIEFINIEGKSLHAWIKYEALSKY